MNLDYVMESQWFSFLCSCLGLTECSQKPKKLQRFFRTSFRRHKISLPPHSSGQVVIKYTLDWFKESRTSLHLSMAEAARICSHLLLSLNKWFMSGLSKLCLNNIQLAGLLHPTDCFINKVMLEHRNTHSFIYFLLWLLFHFKGRIK